MRTNHKNYTRFFLRDVDFFYKKSEVHMWRATILQALVDAMSDSRKPKERAAKIKALDWIVYSVDDFIEICTLAEIDPDYVRTRLISSIFKKYGETPEMMLANFANSTKVVMRNRNKALGIIKPQRKSRAKKNFLRPLKEMENINIDSIVVSQQYFEITKMNGSSLSSQLQGF